MLFLSLIYSHIQDALNINAIWVPWQRVWEDTHVCNKSLPTARISQNAASRVKYGVKHETMEMIVVQNTNADYQCRLGYFIRRLDGWACDE